MRPSSVLQYLPDGVRGSIHQDGEGAEPVSEPDKDLGGVRTSDVLSDK